MNFLQTESQKDFNCIRKLWGEIFGNQHPMIVNKELMNWFYSPAFNPLSSGFIYSKSNNGKNLNPNAFIGYRTVKWFDVEEIWICGFGAKPSFPGAGLFLLRNFLETYAQKNLCVVGFIPELAKVYKSMGFVIEEGFRNLGRVTDTSTISYPVEFLPAKIFFSNYSRLISQKFYDSYHHLLSEHIVWKYFVFIRHNIVFFVRKEADIVCRIVMVYDIGNDDFGNLTDDLIDELYCNIAKHLNCEYIDFVSNINFNIGSNSSNLDPMDDNQLPGYFSPEAPYRKLDFAIRTVDDSKRKIYFKADGDQERSNGQ